MRFFFCRKMNNFEVFSLVMQTSFSKYQLLNVEIRVQENSYRWHCLQVQKVTDQNVAPLVTKSGTINYFYYNRLLCVFSYANLLLCEFCKSNSIAFDKFSTQNELSLWNYSGLKKLKKKMQSKCHRAPEKRYQYYNTLKTASRVLYKMGFSFSN